MLSKVKAYLIKHDVKPSIQRIAVMNYLFNNRTHPTVDEIFSALSPNMPTLSKTTVYSTLKLLAEKGAILQLTIDEKNVRYDACIDPHAHFICLGCGCVHDVAPIYLDKVHMEKYKNLNIIETQVYYKGYCDECLANAAEATATKQVKQLNR
ncbi:MAG: Fur family transcriptional regulator [Paludibacteraceae bacterium]|jgi:Fur family ferric uptake transcriptional regulator/Fur family peroxide stress response transcriptional regulator|nr:Fur family transcriptional regulator [Paludibacteraceae bacterium]